jgi:hypothetical protein
VSEPSGHFINQTQSATSQSTMSPFMESNNISSQGQSSSQMSSTPESSTSSTGMASTPFPSFPTPSGNSQSLPFMSTQPHSTFVPSSGIGSSTNSANFNTIPNATGPTFGGKSPRELLTAFYREKNPSKISDVDSLLIKYQVQINNLILFLYCTTFNSSNTVFKLSSPPCNY